MWPGDHTAIDRHRNQVVRATDACGPNVVATIIEWTNMEVGGVGGQGTRDVVGVYGENSGRGTEYNSTTCLLVHY